MWLLILLSHCFKYLSFPLFIHESYYNYENPINKGCASGYNDSGKILKASKGWIHRTSLDSYTKDGIGIVYTNIPCSILIVIYIV